MTRAQSYWWAAKLWDTSRAHQEQEWKRPCGLVWC